MKYLIADRSRYYPNLSILFLYVHLPNIRERRGLGIRCTRRSVITKRGCKTKRKNKKHKKTGRLILTKQTMYQRNYVQP